MNYRSSVAGLLLLGTALGLSSCRTSREGQEETADSIPAQRLSAEEEGDSPQLPEGLHLVRLRQLTPQDDYRVELIPLLPNTQPGRICRLDGRLATCDPWQGLTHYIYEGTGQTSSCTAQPEAPETLQTYNLAEPLLLPLRGNKELVLEPGDSVAIGLRYWKAMGPAQELQPSTDLEHRAPRAGYHAYELTTPRQLHEDDPEEYYIELIPSKRMKVDCNIHLLRGRFELERSTERGRLHYTFHSDGTTMSTRMGCPEGSLTEKLIRHTGLIVLRWAGSGLQIYVPEGFIMRYRLYRPDGQLKPVTPLPKHTKP